MPVETERGGAPERDHFRKLVADWSHFGPPLRPSLADTAVVQEAIDKALRPGSRVGVLGLTPETITCRWPAGSTLIALDHSPAMVAALWPTAPAPGGPAHAAAVVARWLRLPLPDASLDMVCADGCHTQLAWPVEFAGLATEMCRVLRPGGRFVTRVFTRGAQAETETQIAQAMARLEIGSVHALKLRLLAALHGSDGAGGTGLDAVWRAWRRMPARPVSLRAQRGWTREEIAGIEAYQGLATRYYLPTLDELQAVHAPLFNTLACRFGDYEGAGQCPTLVLERRHAAKDNGGDSD